MTVQPARDQLRADVELGKDLTGTYYADQSKDYYPAMKRIFEALPALLDALDQAEAERDWNLRSSRLSKEERIKANARADQAEAERDQARTQVDRVRALHRKHTPDPEQLPTFVVCTSCWGFDGDFIPYPCATIRALDG